MELRKGSCMCGAVTMAAQGAPKRVGICHCITCRKNSGSAFGLFAVFDASAVTVAGETSHFQSSATGRRHFCKACGAPMFSTWERNEIDLYIGAIEDGESLVPSYELWTARKLDWLSHMPPLEQFEHNRTGV